eukprot:5868084-Prymnesium_polylepis.2
MAFKAPRPMHHTLASTGTASANAVPKLPAQHVSKQARTTRPRRSSNRFVACAAAWMATSCARKKPSCTMASANGVTPCFAKNKPQNLTTRPPLITRERS